MTPSFKQFMSQAARLTRAGNLRAATAAIQSALQRAARDRPPAANDSTPRPAATPLRRSAPAVTAEARDLPLGRFTSGTHSGAAGARDYKLYVPPGADAQQLPLLVMLHGCTQDPDDFAAGTGMNELAQAQGCYVLYPAQSRRANPQACWNWFKHTHQKRGRGEPALLAGMTREVMAQHAIDPARVYVAGLSAGGAMAAILAAAYPDLYAAVGVHSGLAAGAAADLPSALSAMKAGSAASEATVHGVPTIVFHGDADSTVHPANGEHVIKASAGQDCAVETQRASGGSARGWTRQTYTDARSGTVVAEHWVVHGTAHAWSGGRSHGSYTDSRGPDASAQMLRFFLEHPRAR